MEGLELIEPNDLYNMLQQGTHYSSLSNTNYLLLVDARKKHEYNESHIVTAKEGSQAAAVDCGKLFWDMGSRNTVKILKGGYEEFSALYPFLRTQKILFTPRELDAIKPYPIEIIQGLLYLGNWRQGNAAYVQKDLKIKGHINCCIEEETFFPDPGKHLLHIQVGDENDADIHSHFKAACDFFDQYFEEKFAILIFDNLGISRSCTVVLAILMHHHKWTLEEAYKHVSRCSKTIRPNRGFIEQLSLWEVEIFGEKKTNISDPNF